MPLTAPATEAPEVWSTGPFPGQTWTTTAAPTWWRSDSCRRAVSGWPANPRWFDTPAQWSTTPFFGARKTMAADMDADGDADLVAVNGSEVLRS